MPDEDDEELIYSVEDMDQDGVEDDAANEPEIAVTFDISSYGADYTVDSLVRRMNAEAFFVPPFQRAYVWSQRQASRFVESLLLGLPVPGIFVAKEADSARHLIIDGQQRLKTLQFFFNGLFKERAFRLLDIDTRWNGKTIKDLTSDDKQRLEDSVIHTTIFKQDRPTENNSSIYYVFERLNTGASRLYPQEIRNCVNYGPLTEFINDLNKIDDWRAVFGAVNPRMKDQELILRFLAFMFPHKEYARPMKEYLNTFMIKHRYISKDDAQKFYETFTLTIHFVKETLGNRAFRPQRNLNAAVFDSIMVGLSDRLTRTPAPSAGVFLSAYDKLLSDKGFQDAVRRSTADETNVKTRMDLALAAFAGI